jgi:hypothetical protein
MQNATSLSLAALIAVSIIGIGGFYLVSPQRIAPSFGLKPPPIRSRYPCMAAS